MKINHIENLQEDFYIWKKSKSESFLYINDRSRVFPRWLSYSEVKKTNDCIIKPINLYVERLYPKPKIISINKNVVTLQQQNHAEIFLLNDVNEFYNIDRPWVRQYYLSDKNLGTKQECFPGNFRFYMPWFVDDDIDATIKQPDNSPFDIEERNIRFSKVDSNLNRIDPEFIHFNFKKYGKHMIDENFGKIPIGSPMFNIVFEANDIMIDKIKMFNDWRIS